MSDGCYVPDAWLTGWERMILETYTVPRWRGRQLVWDLDEVSPAGLRALCWPRQPADAAPETKAGRLHYG